jgi:hypothetical protein
MFIGGIPPERGKLLLQAPSEAGEYILYYIESSKDSLHQKSLAQTTLEISGEEAVMPWLLSFERPNPTFEAMEEGTIGGPTGAIVARRGACSCKL